MPPSGKSQLDRDIEDYLSAGKPAEGSDDARRFLSVATYATGIAYADRSRERRGDYLRVAFLPFDTLTLEWTPRVKVSAAMRQLILADAARLASRRGESYVIDGAGHTVRLGRR